MPPTARYNHPFHWYGPGWDTPTPHTLIDLLRDGTLNPSTTALLWAALARRSSLVVIGGQAGLGKTTLLTALLPLLPPDTRHLYLRGCFESFAFLDDPAIDPSQTALLINEISPHLPVYLWGPAVHRTLQAAQRGFTLLATAHGASLQEFVASLTASPLRIPAPDLAAFSLVALLEPSPDHDKPGHLSEIWKLQKARNGLIFDRIEFDIIKLENPNSDTGRHLTIAPTAELLARHHHLTALRDGLTDQLPPAVGEGALAPILSSHSDVSTPSPAHGRGKG